MKILKKLSAILLVCIMALSVVGCHKKNEIAVTIEGIQFKSAYYMCALINADIEARSLVDESLSSEQSTTEINYYKQKIEKKSYNDWVKDRAIEMLKEIAAYKSLCIKEKVKLDDDTKASAEYMASYYWQYGAGQLFEPNGVSFETYTDYAIDSSYAELYFKHLYGKDGEKAIAEDTVKSKIYDNFVTANILEVTFSEETDEEKTEIKTKLDTYLANLKDGKTTFKDVYNDYNEITEEAEKEATEETESEEAAPKDEYATIVGSEDTSSSNENFEEIKNMAIGDMKIIEKEDGAGYLLVIKTDIKADSYYTDTLDLEARHLIKDEEYSNEMTEYAKKLKADVNKYAIGQFKVKKIKQVETTQ